MPKAIAFNTEGKMIDQETGKVIEGAPSLNDLPIKGKQGDTLHPSPVMPPPAGFEKQTPPPIAATSVEMPKNAKPPRIKTKYELPDDASFKIEFGIAFDEEGFPRMIAKDDVEFTKGAENHWVEFKMWKYSQELEWKNQCTEFNQANRTHTLNINKLDEIKVRNLLKSWSFSLNEPRLTLLHVNGYLSDESFTQFYEMFPALVKYIIGKMNEQLEYVGR